MRSIQPNWSPSEITSPGLIDLSASRMMPLIRLETIFCRPKPRPTPMAPENSASAERSIPTELMTMMIASTINVMRISLPSRTLIVGVRSGVLWTRLSMRFPRSEASHNATSSSTTVLMISSGVILIPAIAMPTEFEPCRRRGEQAENAQRCDRPGRDRDEFLDERVADDGGGERDHHPGGDQADRDAEQIGPARIGHLQHRCPADDGQQNEDDRRQIAQKRPDDQAQRQRPAQRRIGHIEKTADETRDNDRGKDRHDDDASLQGKPDGREFRIDLRKICQQVVNFGFSSSIPKSIRVAAFVIMMRPA